MVRAPFFDKNGMKKGAWSAEEDRKLRSYIQKYGHWNWRELPKYAGLQRCGKSCRLRWMNYLRPGVKHGNYTEEEDALIMELHEKFGNRWSAIAARLPGRTDNEIKNHWHTHLKRRANRNPTSSDDEGKDYSTTASQSDHEATHNSEAEARSALTINSPPNMILESSPLSPTTSSMTELSSCSSDSGSISNLNMGVSEGFSLLGDQSSGDFWSEPFVADNIYNQDGPQLPYDMYFDDPAVLVDLYQLMQGWL